MSTNTNTNESVTSEVVENTGVPTSIDGVWAVTIHGPTGPQVTSLELKTIDGALTGTQSAMGQVEDVLEPTYDNVSGEIAWVNKIKKPLPLTLKFRGVVEGNTISGHINAAIMGKFPFTGLKG